MTDFLPKERIIRDTEGGGGLAYYFDVSLMRWCGLLDAMQINKITSCYVQQRELLSYWDPKHHTFFTPMEEITPTLENVQHIIGLPATCEPIVLINPQDIYPYGEVYIGDVHFWFYKLICIEVYTIIVFLLLYRPCNNACTSSRYSLWVFTRQVIY